jgi:hypothetical protein
MMTTNSTAAPSLVTLTAESTAALIIAAYSSMRVDLAEELARSLATGRRWQKRRGADRGAAIRAVAQDCCMTCNGVTDVAVEVRRRLIRYAASSWRFERDRDPPDNPARARMHTVLALYGGNVPSESTCWRAIVGIS